eukprot:m.258910 g.258910  ORF g.258910 m.258910 type:complete len:75 (-) comp37246_c0_seq1:1104-1328(-)
MARCGVMCVCMCVLGVLCMCVCVYCVCVYFLCVCGVHMCCAYGVGQEACDARVEDGRVWKMVALLFAHVSRMCA